jgi:hypothetical protein
LNNIRLLAAKRAVTEGVLKNIMGRIHV